MKKLIPSTFIVSLLLIIFSSCDDDTIVGSGLLEGESLNIQFTDTFSVVAKTIFGDSVLVHSPSTGNSTFLLGEVDDINVFGKSSSEIFLQLGVQFGVPDFGEGTLDSMVLVMKLDSSGFYGDEFSSHDISVFLTNSLEETDTIYSNDDIVYLPGNVGSRFYSSISATDSVELMDYKNDSLIVSYPQIRIPIEQGYAESVFMDTLNNSVDSTIRDLVNGFYLMDETMNSMIGLDLSFFSNVDTSNRLVVYYRDENDEKQEYRYYLGGAIGNVFDFETSGTDAENAVDDEMIGESMLYLSSMGEFAVELDLSSVLERQDELLNFAELEFTVAESPIYDTELYPPTPSLLASFRNDEGELEVIEDIVISYTSVFGGSLEEVSDNGMILKKYKMNVTSFVKALIDDPSYHSSLILTSLNPSQTPARTILYGQGHSTYPLRFKLAFTTP